MWIIFSVLVVINFQSIACKCLYENYDFDYPPVFTQQFHSDEFIVKSDRRPIVISEGSYIKAYCDSNFSTPIFDDPDDLISSVHVKCWKEVLHYINDDRKIETHRRPKLACHESQPKFKHGGLYCSQNTAVDFGLQVNQNKIILSRFCYDVKKMETSVIHYQSGDHSTILKTSRGYNDSRDLPINFIDSNKVRTDEMNSFFNKNSSHTMSLPQYRFDYLVPAERLVKGFTYQTEVLEGLSSIPWWTSLKEGNWKIFEDILEKKILSKECEMYTGILHYDQLILAKEQERETLRTPNNYYPDTRFVQNNKYNNNIQPLKNIDEHSNDAYRRRQESLYAQGYRKKRTLLDFANTEENDIAYMSSNIAKSIPFYVWTYIKPRNSTIESVVVIAINSPFVQADNYRRHQFCPDMCRDIPWLKEFETAKMPALGYIFCCQPNDASKFIPEMAYFIQERNWY